jgi:predicted RNase H-like HicB family nuclease
MLRQFTLEYWTDDGWYVGRLKEVPNVFSQGENLNELQNNIQDAYQLMLAEQATRFDRDLQHLEIEVEV